jgi:hypothetical protein
MGTNYYVKAEEKPACPTCGHRENVEALHIGKSSHGWAFIFAPYPELRLTSWRAWRLFLTSHQIVDEYGREHTFADFVRLVESKQEGNRIDSHDRGDSEGYRFSTTSDFS